MWCLSRSPLIPEARAGLSHPGGGLTALPGAPGNPDGWNAGRRPPSQHHPGCGVLEAASCVRPGVGLIVEVLMPQPPTGFSPHVP